MKTYFHSGGDKHLVGGKTFYIEIPSLPTADACRPLIKQVVDGEASFVRGIIGVAKHNPKDGPFKKKVGNSIALQNSKDVLFKIESFTYYSKCILLNLSEEFTGIKIQLTLMPNRKGPYINVYEVFHEN